MERKVKGTLVKLIVKGIKSDKTNKINYDNYLSDEAKELLDNRILDSVWYSFDTYFEIYFALAKFYAKNNNEIFIKWGHEFGQALMSTIYKNIVNKGNLDKLIEKYPRFHRLVFNFGNIVMEKVSNNEISVSYRDFEPKFEFWYYTAVGWVQKSIEMCIKKKVNYKFLKKSWIGDEYSEFKLYYEN